MRIGINLLFLLPGVVAGTEFYARELLNALGKIDDKNQYFVFINEESVDIELGLPDTFQIIECPVQATRRGKRYFFEQFNFPFWINRLKLDLVHSLGYVGPILALCKKVVSIHDVNYAEPSHNMAPLKALSLKIFVKLAALSASRIITISNFSKTEIVKHLKVPAEKVEAIHIAGRQKPEIIVEWSTLKERYALEKPYVAMLGGHTLNKNVPRMVEAFLRLDVDVPHKLVIIGRLRQEFQSLVGRSDRISATGYVQDDDVMPLLQNADIFFFPSLYEGFGLPLLEAQTSCTPVAASNVAALPEVAGDSVRLFDPYSVDSIEDALRECVSDDVLRADLVRRGSQNVQRFSWKQAATETLAVYEDVCS